MKARNVVIISMDEVPHYNLSCYGYERIETTNIDRIAREGVLFERCIGPGCLTPICMSSVMCGQYPNKHGFRVPFHRIQSKTAAQMFKERGYQTAGFVGNGLLCSLHGFNAGFDVYGEPTADTSPERWYITTDSGEPAKEGDELVFYAMNEWFDDMLQWLDEHHDKPFFIWGHVQETHEGSEIPMLEDGRLEEGVMPEFSYKDARIKYVDQVFFGALLELFDRHDLWRNTLLVVMADHGHNVGEHPVKVIPLRPGGIKYPQHRSLYDHEITVPLIVMDPDLPKGRRIPGLVRSIDLIPTILSHLEIATEEFDFDGQSLLPWVEKGEAKGLWAYAEDLFEYRTEKFKDLDTGSLQALRTEKVKLIRNLTKGTEEYFDLDNDPGERKNRIDEVRTTAEVVELRRTLNSFLFQGRHSQTALSSEQMGKVQSRLRSLGYIV